MGRFHRKTAPDVRDGRTLRKNNWAFSPGRYLNPTSHLLVDRRRPGDGYRHLLLKRDIERFVNLIPDWPKLSEGLSVVTLDRGQSGCDGWYNRGVLGVCAWPLEMSYPLRRSWYYEHCRFLERIGARVGEDRDGDFIIHWTPDTARAYQLCHVFLHELGHHADRMHTRTKQDNGPRGEPFAEDYAFDLERVVLERYFAEFGLPE